MTRRCQTDGCRRDAEPGYANCRSDTRRLMKAAFGPDTAPLRKVERLSIGLLPELPRSAA